MALGRVTEFDPHRGYGTIGDESGDEHFFHCTAIADGSRTIEPGTTVSYQLTPGHHGRFEASSVTPT